MSMTLTSKLKLSRKSSKNTKQKIKTEINKIGIKKTMKPTTDLLEINETNKLL